MSERIRWKQGLVRVVYVVLWGIMFFAGGCSCNENPGIGNGCQSCPIPERCVQTGSKFECVACVTDQHCRDGGNSTKKCLKNRCICGGDADCPTGQRCAGERGCLECLEDKDCAGFAEKPVCAPDGRCAACRFGSTRACVPEGKEDTVCQKGVQKCGANLLWGFCEGWKDCNKCTSPAVCLAGDIRCSTGPEEMPGKYYECVLDKDDCPTWSSAVKSCPGTDKCQNNKCIPERCKAAECPLGNKRCGGDGKSLETCGRNQDGCIVWLAPEACPNNNACENNRCKDENCKPTNETCNGKDDNCDGKIDETFADLGRTCEVGKGVCKQAGKKVCTADGQGTECNAKAGTGSPEQCNGQDDDCDGQIDNGATCPDGKPCNNGVCGTPEPGCADGTRELFTNMAKYPTIAGCAGFYRGESLRLARQGQNCGATSSQECKAAEDLCASGWHICMKNGDPNDMKNRVTGPDCASDGAGLFVAASSHCVTSQPACSYGASGLPCTQGGPCSEPICCGKDCQFGLCKDAVWANETRCARPQTFIGCGNANSFHGTPLITGVLCCKD